jgi:diphthamide biosynthesis methyltransferase
LVLIEKALSPFVDILSNCDKVFAIKYVESIKNALIERLDNLTENEIKELDKEIIKRTI